MSGLQDALDGKLDAATFDDLFEKVNIGTTSAPKYAIRAKYGLYADGFLSSLGLNSSGGGGTGGGSYDRLDLWNDYTSERAGWVLSAALGYDLYNRVRSLEGGSALSFTDEGTGNVVTAVKKSGTAVIVTKGLTALTSHQPIYSLNFQAGAFEAKKYTPNTGVQTVNVPTKTSHLSNDSGFITSAALTGYATQSWVQGLGYITASALTPYITAATANATFATKLGVSGNQIGTYVNGKLGNLITVPYATNADTLDMLHSADFFRQFDLGGGSGKSFDFNTITDGGYSFCSRDILDATFVNAPVSSSAGGFGLLVLPYSSYRSQMFFHYLTNSIFARCRYFGGSDYAWTTWKRIAYTDSNVASATKLETARTLWGQSFDGSGNVSGDMTGVGSISASGEIKTTSANSFRMIYGDYAAFWRNDGQSLYLLLTNAGDPNGTFNAFRPFYVELGSGTVRIGNSTLNVQQGNVGIKTINPAYELDVSGVIHSTTGIFSDSYMSAKGINTASDVRLKRRIADVALTVRDVAEAPVYRFAWINGGGIDVGSTAQYWGARVPELTHLLADGIHLGLDYGKAALLSVVAVARATADHERRIADIERQLQNRTI